MITRVHSLFLSDVHIHSASANLLWHQVRLAWVMLFAGRNPKAVTAVWLESHVLVNAVAAAVCDKALRDFTASHLAKLAKEN